MINAIHALISLATIIIATTFTQVAYADLNSDIAAACASGGTVKIPTSYTASTTINLVCPTSGDMPINLEGAPSKITCATGIAPCIHIGSNDAGGASRNNLSLKSVYLIGPGRTLAGSVGIYIDQHADQSSLSDVRIDNFDTGMVLYGPSNDLLWSVFATNIEIGTSGLPINPSVNLALHLNGHVANVKFVKYHFGGMQRLILSDGPGGTGAGATFIGGILNTTKTPGTAAVYVTSSDTITHEILFSATEDWETACPFLDVGEKGRVVIDGLAFTGDPWSSGSYPAFKLSGTIAWLRISNAELTHCTGTNPGSLIEVDNSLDALHINGSDLGGPIQFIGAGWSAIVGNRFTNPALGCYTGTTTKVRASANVGCPDM